jgi:hypothetical protein
MRDLMRDDHSEGVFVRHGLEQALVEHDVAAEGRKRVHDRHRVIVKVNADVCG